MSLLLDTQINSICQATPRPARAVLICLVAHCCVSIKRLRDFISVLFLLKIDMRGVRQNRGRANVADVSHDFRRGATVSRPRCDSRASDFVLIYHRPSHRCLEMNVCRQCLRKSGAPFLRLEGQSTGRRSATAGHLFSFHPSNDPILVGNAVCYKLNAMAVYVFLCDSVNETECLDRSIHSARAAEKVK